jgi:hypothetical protein
MANYNFNDNLFEIRKSPESIIAAQALTFDDFVYKTDTDFSHDKCATGR